MGWVKKTGFAGTLAIILAGSNAISYHRGAAIGEESNVADELELIAEVSPEAFAAEIFRRAEDPVERAAILQAWTEGALLIPMPSPMASLPEIGSFCGTCPKHAHNRQNWPCPDHPATSLCAIDSGVPAPTKFWCSVDGVVYDKRVHAPPETLTVDPYWTCD